jgi:hypothetical protein
MVHVARFFRVSVQVDNANLSSPDATTGFAFLEGESRAAG